VEIDRQLNLPDLLSSALLTTETSSFARALAHQAEGVTQNLLPSVLIFNRLGARSWSGIGLAAALVLTVAMMFSSPQPLRARSSDAAHTESNHIAALNATAKSPRESAASDVRSHAARSEWNTRHAAHPFESGSSSPQRSAARSSTIHNGSSVDNGSGGGTSRTNDHAQMLQPGKPSDTLHANEGIPAAGGAGRATTAMPDGQAASSGVVSRDATFATPPWRKSSWQADRESGLDAARSGAVPDAYRDLVRDYFSR
jgi:hypothetical protein